MKTGCQTLTSILLTAALLASACTSAPRAATAPAAPPARDTHENLHATLWMQTAAEYRALAELAYRLARRGLDEALADPGWTAALEQTAGFASLPPAIILDIDETVLDNSPCEGRMILERRPYDQKTWERWVNLAAAVPVPGALEFCRYAASRGVAVFYVTNREAREEASTLANLKAAGFPVDARPDPILTKGERPDWGSDKGTRRALLAGSYRILLLVGDDLGDFVSGARATPAQRAALVENNVARWGSRWILLPNPVYGSWEKSLFDFDRSLTQDQVMQRKFKAVRGF